ncbi:hypothetical protein KKE85_01015, partial [Patescibacteria group bacterium]|nr:hypothetical protein [Patescibacteria group bacterium]
PEAIRTRAKTILYVMGSLISNPPRITPLMGIMKINECRELCKFQPATEVKESAGRLYQTGGTGAHWYFGESSQRKIFETQEQCLEYCLNQE